MAIKISNQITFTEQKKIEKIEEWYLATSQDSDITIDTSGWTTEIQTINEEKCYLWNYEKVIYSLGDPEISEPIIIGFYGKGTDGRSILDITNYYQLTTDTNPPTSWQETVLMLDPINRYLWNYEKITYTSGDPTTTDPAIIGVYGDSGTDAIDFQIYSVDGFEFNDALNSINLQTVAFQGGSSIENSATYQWKWWNVDSTLDDKYEDINGATSSVLTVNSTDLYAFASLRCDMTYDGITYSDYVTLTTKTELYTSSIKFFDGGNIFNQEKSYIVAYIEVYKNSQLDETKWANEYYDGDNTVTNDTIIQTDISESSNYSGRTFEENETMYFICKNSNGDYVAIVGQYSGGAWNVYTPESKYTYLNDFYVDQTSNVVVISKQDVSKSAEINIEVYQSGTFVTKSSATIIDTNDPIISDTEPTNVKLGQLWLDTSTDPYVLKIYSESKGTYTLGEASDLTLSYALGTSGGSASTEVTRVYCEDITVSNDGSIKLINEDSVTFSYSTYTEAQKLQGMFCVISDVVYYIPDNSIKRASGTSGVKYWKVYAVDAQEVLPQENTSAGTWEYFSQQNGGAVYTSIPLDGYSEGDLWIISDADVSLYTETYPDLFDQFGSGTMLRSTVTSSTFNERHWTDAMEETTAIINNVKQYFEFNADTGLKIGRKDERFYVNIDAEEMGFYDNTGDDPQKVVYISNSTANIDNVLIEGSAEFDCEATFNDKMHMYNEAAAVSFVWQIEESNGSLSLILG